MGYISPPFPFPEINAVFNFGYILITRWFTKILLVDKTNVGDFSDMASDWDMAPK